MRSWPKVLTALNNNRQRQFNNMVSQFDRKKNRIPEWDDVEIVFIRAHNERVECRLVSGLFRPCIRPSFISISVAIVYPGHV